MGDFDAAIAIAVALAIEEETDVPKRKRAKCSKEWFLQRSVLTYIYFLQTFSLVYVCIINAKFIFTPLILFYFICSFRFRSLQNHIFINPPPPNQNHILKKGLKKNTFLTYLY